MVTTETADSVLKSYYLGVVAEALDKSTNPLLAAIRKTTSDVWGRDVKKAVRYGVNGGIGAGTEAGDLPAANGNGYAQFVVPLKNLYGTVEISDKAIRASQNAEGSFVDLLNDEMDGLVKSSSFNMGRMLYGDGSGKLATISSAESTTYTVDSVRNLAEGMTVDVYNAGGSKVATGRTVTGISYTEKTVILSGDAISTPSNYYLVLQGSKDLELTGLAAIFGSETLYGVEREGKSWMTPCTVSVSGTLKEADVLKAIDGAEQQSGGRINFIVCSYGVRRALFNLLSANKTPDTVELNGGYRAMAFNGIPVVADRFCPEGTMYLLNTDDFAIHQLCDWQWLEGEDGKVLKQVPGKPVYTATLVKYAELLCYRPGGQAQITGITEA